MGVSIPAILAAVSSIPGAIAAPIAAGAADLGIPAAIAGTAGTIGADALLGAGLGAGEQALTGGKPLKGAEFGGLGGAALGGISSLLGGVGGAAGGATAGAGAGGVGSAAGIAAPAGVGAGLGAETMADGHIFLGQIRLIEHFIFVISAHSYFCGTNQAQIRIFYIVYLR